MMVPTIAMENGLPCRSILTSGVIYDIQTQLFHWNNHVRRITFTSLHAIAQALNVSFTDLFLDGEAQQGALEQRVQD